MHRTHYRSGMGMMVVDAVDATGRYAGVFDPSILPEKRISEYPLIRSFVARNPGLQAEPITKIQNRMEAIEKKWATKKSLEKNDFGELEITAKGLDEWDVFLPLKEKYKALNSIHKLIGAITRDPNIDRAQKRQLIEDNYKEAFFLATEMNKDYIELKSDFDQSYKENAYRREGSAKALKRQAR